MLEDFERGPFVRQAAVTQPDKRFRNNRPERVCCGYDSSLRDAGLFQSHTFQLEGANPVARRLEHVVGAANEGDAALRIH